MSTFADEPKIPLQTAIRANPNTRHVDDATPRRWATKGVRIPGTKTWVRLEAIRIGVIYYTSADAVARFVADANTLPLGAA